MYSELKDEVSSLCGPRCVVPVIVSHGPGLVRVPVCGWAAGLAFSCPGCQMAQEKVSAEP